VLAAAVALPALLAAGAAAIALLGPAGAGGPDARASHASKAERRDAQASGGSGGSGASGGSGDTAGAPVRLPAVPAPAATTPECAALLAALPGRLPGAGGELARRLLAEPAPAGSAAWGDGPRVVLRCGVDRPAELTPTAGLLEVGGVRWLRTGEGAGGTTWVACDRPVYVALTVAAGTGTGPIQDVSTVISATLGSRVVISTP